MWVWMYVTSTEHSSVAAWCVPKKNLILSPCRASTCRSFTTTYTKKAQLQNNCSLWRGVAFAQNLYWKSCMHDWIAWLLLPFERNRRRRRVSKTQYWVRYSSNNIPRFEFSASATRLSFEIRQREKVARRCIQILEVSPPVAQKVYYHVVNP